MLKMSKTKLAIVGGTTALALAGAGTAIAYWTTSGSGTATTDTAKTGTTSPITINQTSALVTLYPNTAADSSTGIQLLAGTFTNTTNPGAVYVTSVVASIGSLTNVWKVSATGHPDCTAADFSIKQPDPVNAEIAHGTSVGSWSGGTVFLKDTALDQDNCKGVTPPITYTSN